MKKYWLLGMLAVSVLFGGCASKKWEDYAESKGFKENISGSKISKVEVEGTGAFAKVGADIETPAGAENARYFIISERIAEIIFDRNEVQYSYRASQLEEDLTSIQDAQVLEDTEAIVGSYAIPIQISDSGYLAVWKWGGISYSLTAQNQAEKEIVKSLVEELARETMPAQI